MKDIPEIVKFLKSLPEKMEGFDDDGALSVLDTHKLADKIDEAYHSVVEYAVIRTNKYMDSWVEGIFSNEDDANAYLKLHSATIKAAGHEGRIIKNIKGRRIWSETV
jgi:hypothetical protein